MEDQWARPECCAIAAGLTLLRMNHGFMGPAERSQGPMPSVSTGENGSCTRGRSMHQEPQLCRQDTVLFLVQDVVPHSHGRPAGLAGWAILGHLGLDVDRVARTDGAEGAHLAHAEEADDAVLEDLAHRR